MSYEEYIISVLDKYKRKDPREKLIITPILGKHGNTIGFLRPVTADFKKTMPNCAELFGTWRKENPTFSPSRFIITEESTENWLANNIINNSQRILFAILNLPGEYIGHIGFANFRYSTKTAEVDCVLRGVKNKIPQLMEYAMRTLIHWGKEELLLEHIDLKVLWDNEHAISFYQRCGFQKRELIPLKRVEINGEIQWHSLENSEVGAEKYYLHMVSF